MKMEKTVQIRDAVLKTLKVEIKSLSINGKQMTQAVFRQLIGEPLINVETGELKGVPWGTVNYHPGCKWLMAEDTGHLHVVWQKGDELRQAYERVPSGTSNRVRYAFGAFALILAYKVGAPTEEGLYRDRRYVWGDRSIPYNTLDDQGLTDCLRFRPSSFARVDSKRMAEERFKYSKEIRGVYERDYSKDLKGEPLGIEEISPEDAHSLVQQIMRSEYARLRLHRENFATLQTLDQLFIAV